ncbi:hypothetical protein [Pseudoalteromonas sp. McH1-42]|uniref:hypothetical protein n=1 Tax=Pseudoalteromonas sp. McH1-42 TaxID=2917752 RepID=UPI001EF5032A|nr:hypothetical protein [Pseudoalteromonas sp. McH1-42]MCG7563104.1 hypothetical protein [Pseudoalteromonas sp. McH1-42]
MAMLYVIEGPVTVTTKKLIMRLLGVVVGIAFILIGLWVLINPIYGDLTEVLNQIFQILLGLMFLFYEVTVSATSQARIKALNSKPIVMHGGIAKQANHTFYIVFGSGWPFNIPAKLNK